MRTPLQGVLQIMRFNWPFYAALVGVIGVTASLGGLFTIVALGTAYLTVASLAASYWVYDHSDLYTLRWLDDALPTPCSKPATRPPSGEQPVFMTPPR